MKRDMELIRLLLLNAEGEAQVDLSEYTDEQIVYHSALLIDAELVVGAVCNGANGYPRNAVIVRLNWNGHEFLDAARNQPVWQKVMEKAKSGGASLPLSVIQALLIDLLKKSVGL